MPVISMKPGFRTLLAFTVLACISCKPKQSETASLEGQFDNLSPGIQCFAKGLPNEDQESFDPFQTELLNNGQVDPQLLKAFSASNEFVPCSQEVITALNTASPSQNIASTIGNEPEATLGLVGAVDDIVRGGIIAWKILSSRANSLSQIVVRFRNGTTKIFQIARRGKDSLLSPSLRMKVLPHSNKIFRYSGPRFVKAERLDPSRYNILMKSLEAHRVTYMQKFQSWVSSGKATRSFTIRFSDLELPKDPLIAQGVKEIANLFSSPVKMFSHLQGLEMDIAKRMASKGEKMEDALEALLSAQEKKHGFQTTVDLSTLLPELEQHHLQSGTLFRDRGFFNPGTSHGQQTHRIQWYVIMRHLEETTALKGKLQGVQLYKAFGNMPKKGSKEWGDGWLTFFDSFSQYDTFARVENWRHWFSEFLPTLAGWP